MNRTFGIIKPDAVRKGHVGAILAAIEDEGLKVVGLRMDRLSRDEAMFFYGDHVGKPFFKSLVEFMASGPVVLMVLEGENAMPRWRKLMGATDSSKAEPGTIRARFGNPLVVRENAVHGSDGLFAAHDEIGFFFSALDIGKAIL